MTDFSARLTMGTYGFDCDSALGGVHEQRR